MKDNGHTRGGVTEGTEGIDRAVQCPAEPKKKRFDLSEAVYRTGVIAAKTAAGIGVGAAAGVGTVAAIAAAEITLPTLLVLKVFGFAGGALGFLSGVAKKK